MTGIKDARVAIDQFRQAVATLRRSRLISGMRPDKYLRMAAAIRREGRTNTIGIALSARRCPDRPALIDERGVLTYRQLDDRANALAAALQQLPGGAPRSVAILCRNHRGFVDGLAAADRVGAHVLLLNTSFAGPALAEVVERERPNVLIYDEEFADRVERATTNSDIARVIAWTDAPGGPELSIDKLIAAHAGQRPYPPRQKGSLILLTSGTTGTPKGAKRTGGGGLGELVGVLSVVPWRAEEPVVLAAPMFHAWGYGQLVLGAMLSCTIVVRRKFEAEETIVLVDRHQASGLSVVPVMLDRIMELPEAVRSRYSGRSLRFVTASGSRMNPDVVIRFMDQFGDVVYNNYNATEVGLITAATPADLRAAPDTAGKPMPGVDVRIWDENYSELGPNQVGQIFARSATQFDGYTSGTTKDMNDGYMASGDLGYFDHAGRLFVVGRDDEMIVSGGENVYPIEVEKSLLEHPDVAEAAVMGVDDERFGQRFLAFVVPRPSSALTADLLKEHVRQNLANYKVPRDIMIVQELPRSSTGKVSRKELYALASDSQADTVGQNNGS
ncbi:acyl-CoA ligase FadD12 [Mycobacterium sp. UM_CSW]|uniref:acyl-CoA ligase FadD12 n=1 Tax=Mycobacterium sp. UM_CSW TaxID=1370119 RepID=UPI0004227C12|nr:acyl-CoA ligase FadD12 [Mycobacterium sp. UM_CSW]